MGLKGTKTEENLLKAFAGESQARTRYTFFASKARKEGYVQISNLFLETAENEKEHAKVFFKHLEGGTAEITATYPAGKIASTAENLRAAADGEKEEWDILYPDFADVAEKEGFADCSGVFPRDRRGRVVARAPLSQAPRQRGAGYRLQAQRAGALEVRELRLRPRRCRGTLAVSCLQSPTGPLRDLDRAVLDRPDDYCAPSATLIS